MYYKIVGKSYAKSKFTNLRHTTYVLDESNIVKIFNIES